ncbi:MAG: hypothetical protein MUE67_08480 [Anaerolineales bacterium]|jgi:tetratricopeptide (TPR) repeat protein|nr:hypothetical protein [Anaerolineales bacterium]
MPKPALRNLARLPMRPETWHLTIRKLTQWVFLDEDQPSRPYLALLTNLDQETIQDFELSPDPIQGDDLRNLIGRAIEKPSPELHTPPHRPRELVCDDSEILEGLDNWLAEIGIRASHQSGNETIDQLVAMLEAEISSTEDTPALLEIERFGAALLSDFFESAAQTFKLEPWVHLTPEQVVRYSVPKLGKEGYAQILGNSRIEFGILFYEKWEDIEQSYLNTSDLRETLLGNGRLALSYVTADLISAQDLNTIHQHGWPVASPEAYPLPMRMQPEEIEAVTVEELTTLVLLLKALPGFANSLEPDLQGDYLPLTTDSPLTCAGTPLTIRLEYPAGELSWQSLPARIALDDLEGEMDDETSAAPAALDGLSIKYLEPGQFDASTEEEDELDLDEGDEFLEDWERHAIARSKPELVEAMALIYQAWDEMNPTQRIQLARQALERSPECAEAYNLLAEDLAVNQGQELKYYQKAVETGLRAVGEAFIEQHRGALWQETPARPYLRGLAGMTRVLWGLGRREEAARYFKELLSLDEEDALYAHFGLQFLYLEMGQWAEAHNLSRQFANQDCQWLYNCALISFRQLGEQEEPQHWLAQALKSNPYVPDYLSGRLRLPAEQPESIRPGQKSEAIQYASIFNSFWRQAPGAIDWLRKTARAGEKTTQARRKSKKTTRRR